MPMPKKRPIRQPGIPYLPTDWLRRYRPRRIGDPFPGQEQPDQYPQPEQEQPQEGDQRAPGRFRNR